MNKFILIKQNKRIIKPLKKFCSCGNPVLNHHFFCDSCWSKRKKIKDIKAKNEWLLRNKNHKNPITKEMKRFLKMKFVKKSIKEVTK